MKSIGLDPCRMHWNYAGHGFSKSSTLRAALILRARVCISSDPDRADLSHDPEFPELVSSTRRRTSPGACATSGSNGILCPGVTVSSGKKLNRRD